MLSFWRYTANRKETFGPEPKETYRRRGLSERRGEEIEIERVEGNPKGKLEHTRVDSTDTEHGRPLVAYSFYRPV